MPHGTNHQSYDHWDEYIISSLFTVIQFYTSRSFAEQKRGIPCDFNILGIRWLKKYKMIQRVEKQKKNEEFNTRGSRKVNPQKLNYKRKYEKLEYGC